MVNISSHHIEKLSCFQKFFKNFPGLLGMLGYIKRFVTDMPKYRRKSIFVKFYFGPFKRMADR